MIVNSSVWKGNLGLSVIYYVLICCAFLSFHFLPINPVYVIGAILIIISLMTINFIKVDLFLLELFAYAFLSGVCFFIGTYTFLPINYDPNISSSILFIFCILLGVSVIQIGFSIPLIVRRKKYLEISNFLILFMFLDLVTRLLLSKGGGGFYDYKFGIFYFDSNFTGNILLAFLMFFVFLKKNKILDIGFFRFFILFVLLCGTFSRAAIFSFLISLILMNLSKKYLTIFICLASLLGSFILYKMVNFYLNGGDFMGVDASFNSKFFLIDIAIQNYQMLPLINKFFGIGLNNFSYFSDGMFAHNVFITLFYEFGYVGILLFFLIFLLFYIKVKKNSLYLLFPFFICSFSLFSAYMPFFFIIMACIYVESKTNNLC